MVDFAKSLKRNITACMTSFTSFCITGRLFQSEGRTGSSGSLRASQYGRSSEQQMSPASCCLEEGCVPPEDPNERAMWAFSRYRAIQSECEHLYQRIDDLEYKNKLRDKRVEESLHSNQELKDIIRQLTQKYNEREQDNQRLRKKIDQLEDEKSQLQEEINTMKKQKASDKKMLETVLEGKAETDQILKKTREKMKSVSKSLFQKTEAFRVIQVY